MTKNNDGGPAFPTPAHNLQNDGMTLRDYFAAKAMQAMLQSGNFGPKLSDALYYGDDMDRVMDKSASLAEGAYEMADAMLSTRKTNG